MDPNTQQTGLKVGPVVLHEDGLLQAVVAALLALRMLMPTESAADGHTLWIAQLWLAAALLWIWRGHRRGTLRFCVGWCDLFVWLIVVGHVVSSLIVVCSTGEKRAAVNMLWEWIALGISFVLIRHIIFSQAAQQKLLMALAGIAVVLATLGMWQHYVTYPRQSAEYFAKRRELTQLQQAGVNADQRRLRELQAEFARAGIPQESQGRLIFEQRLASREPFGLFVLANTFAGLLLVWLIVLLGWGLRDIAGQGLDWKTGLILLAVAVTAYCLVLTKCRSAWVGFLVAVSVWGCLQWWSTFRRHAAGRMPSTSRRQRALGFILVVLLLAGLPVVAAATGGLDRAVLSETPKSLRYRIEYWIGSWQTIRERLLWGVGPGNYRANYLRYKLEESSEEISDPHNLFLDVWAAGGMLAVVGITGLVVIGLKSLAPRTGSQDNCAEGRVPGLRSQVSGREREFPLPEFTDGSLPTSQTLFRDPILRGVGLGFVAVLSAKLFWVETVDYRVGWLFVGWLATMLMLGRLLLRMPVQNQIFSIAFLAFVIHLLGAGSPSMPYVGQTLLLLVALQIPADPNRQSELSSAGKPKRQSTGLRLLMASLAVLLVTCLASATWPVFWRTSLVDAGKAALFLDGNSRQADQFFQQAAQADPLSPEPWNQLSQLKFLQWSQSISDSERDFEQAVEYQRQAINRNPRSYQGYRTLGLWNSARHRRTKRPKEADAAVVYFRSAMERYPTQSRVHAEIAQALCQAGLFGQAAAEAEEALRLDQINRRLFHFDRMFLLDMRVWLRKVARGRCDRAGPIPN